MQPDKSRTRVLAKTGSFDHKANVLELFQSIDVTSDGGLKAKLTRATITTKDNVLVTKEPVTVEFPAGLIRSKAMSLRQKTRDISFTGGVETRLTPKKEDVRSAATPLPASVAGLAAAEEASGAASLFRPSEEPIDITSSQLDVKDTEKRALFSGDVKARQGAAVMATPELEVFYDGDAPAGGKGADNSGLAGATAAGGKIRRIVAKGPVVMTRGESERVDSASAEFDTQNETAILIGNVVMAAGSDRRATSDRVDLDQRADTALLTGSVVVVQGENELKGRRLFIDRRGGKAQLTAPPGAGAGPGRVTARLVQGGADAKGAKRKNEAAGGGLGSFRTDPNAPVEVEADQLDVNDAQRTAVFRGDVKAVQGDFVIRTSELAASYSGEARLADVSDAPGSGSSSVASRRQAEVTRIDARKNVVVTSKDGQMARGDWAVYDAKAKTVTLGGEVNLSKGESMVRGTRLIIDMVSGESTLETDPKNQNEAPGAGGWMTAAPDAGAAGNRGRPSAVLFPKTLQEAKDGAKSENPAGSAKSGWSAAPD